jgi:hypothetical protein
MRRRTYGACATCVQRFLGIPSLICVTFAP